MRRFFRQIVMLAALSVLAGCDAAQSPLAPADETVPTAEPLAALTTSQILFMSWNAQERADIVKIDPQGTGMVNLTNTGTSSEYEPAWSYDHKRIAYSRPRLDANKVWHDDIYVMNADGTNKHWARSSTYTSALNHPAWSPDGTHLLVNTVLQGQSVLATIELSTGKLALVGPKGQLGVQGLYGEYDPSGKSILYLSSVDYTIRQFVPGADEKILLTTDRRITNATFSPDGKKVAYGKYLTYLNSEVYVLTLATGISKRLTFNSVFDEWPTWSPDGTRLAFASSRSGKLQIWTMNASTGGSATKVTSVGNANLPRWWH